MISSSLRIKITLLFLASTLIPFFIVSLLIFLDFPQALGSLAFSFGLLAVLIISLSAFLSEIILRPIKSLINSVKKIAAGDLTTRATINSHDEIGQLAVAFNEMVTKLKESHSFLEEKVKYRTTQLEHNVVFLEDAKKAALNILEDLNSEKANLAEAKSKDEALLASIGDGVIATNTTERGRIILMNKAAELMLGWQV